ncbi:hypothetical protein ACOZ4F_00490 (plasmid) [Haloarcula marismortui]|uniref:hypothetical protein n=1 Tax=Haloarcula marismortui TaxID=2238 RepID=UPI003C79431F
MEVKKGEVFEFPSGGYVIIAEDKQLEGRWDEVDVVWHLTEDLGDYYQMELNDLTSLDRTGKTVDVPGNDPLTKIDRELGFVHESCNREIVTHKDFFSLGGQWSLDVMIGVIEHIIKEVVGGVVALLIELKSLVENYRKISTFSPEEWFENVQLRGGTYHCQRCGGEIVSLEEL